MPILPEHLKVEVKREYHGGQSTGDFDSGVTITHLPTGLKAFCNYERSQLKNRRVAVSTLEYGLAELNIT